MRIRFVGSGDAFGTGGRWQTCIHLSAEGRALLVRFTRWQIVLRRLLRSSSG
jgi:hypothetical protein